MSSVPVALITAGSAGLGAAAARLFVKNGFKVVINYNNNVERAEKLAEELKRSSGSDVLAIKADLGNRDDISKLVEETIQKMGQLNVVFSNGGWTHFRDIMNLDDNVVEDDWDRCFNINVKSHVWLMHAAKKHLDETEGAFITTASVAGAYSVTKAAQIHLAKVLAVIAAPKIRVNSISPGLLLTDWGAKFSDDAKAAHIEKTKIKRAATVEVRE
ncbi:versicolorin reductase [Colletotrichum spaethianum]|uniref:Versicolorin reductase n=1 Tax=Colletotrichum spaethianum TaxID=700344 RepID=A0AA37PHF0_9PEZI|nr:versicolorin reductase [Colletotrichum spaethianum]GKT52197.1 versicolorin reductase [Colletotrichum spaethianum]